MSSSAAAPCLSARISPRRLTSAALDSSSATISPTAIAPFVKWGPFIEGDNRNKTHITQAVVQIAPLAILHCAALTEVGESVRNPAAFFENNVGGAINVAMEPPMARTAWSGDRLNAQMLPGAQKPTTQDTLFACARTA